ncbi:MAG: tyrosine-type recombinase/integrase, partial [Nocardioides sp.]|uniref:tyrosine-type recombinase/integrase n=1 Tax=Nocardioides sp. TaxID=35761 RepID=UPI0032669358
MAYVVERRTIEGTSRFLANYRDPEGRVRSAGTFPSRRAADRAANREEQRVLAGNWRDSSLGAVPFQQYVEVNWLPSKHIEPTTKAAYVSNLNKHFIPFFGARLMYQITPSLVQDWVTKAAADGLSARSIRKYHTMLHSIFKRAVRDQLIVGNPCEHTELPKVITKKTRTLTPDEFRVLIESIPDQHRLMVETAIETGMRWGELIALRPRHIDFLRRTITVQDTIIEVSKTHSPTGERFINKPYPKNNEPRTLAVRRDWLDAVAKYMNLLDIDRDGLLFTTTVGTPISRNTFRTRVWIPAVKASGISFAVRMHDLRHAHASWLLAGGSDLKSVMDRLGHAQIQTTQKYLHALDEADQRNLDALDRMTRRQ